MQQLTIEEIVIRCLYVSMSDHMNALGQYGYWEMYQHSLDMMSGLFKNHGMMFAVKHMNLIMSTAPSYTGRTSAVVDVATTLETLAPEKYAGTFKYA